MSPPPAATLISEPIVALGYTGLVDPATARASDVDLWDDDQTIACSAAALVFAASERSR
jgi:hypothetical protein